MIVSIIAYLDRAWLYIMKYKLHILIVYMIPPEIKKFARLIINDRTHGRYVIE